MKSPLAVETRGAHEGEQTIHGESPAKNPFPFAEMSQAAGADSVPDGRDALFNGATDANSHPINTLSSDQPPLHGDPQGDAKPGDTPALEEAAADSTTSKTQEKTQENKLHVDALRPLVPPPPAATAQPPVPLPEPPPTPSIPASPGLA